MAASRSFPCPARVVLAATLACAAAVAEVPPVPRLARAPGFLETELSPPGPVAGNQAGVVVATDGRSVAVATSPAAGSAPAAVWVFRDRSGGGWTSVASDRVEVGDGAAGEGAVVALAVDRQSLLVGGVGVGWLVRDTSAASDWSQTTRVRLAPPGVHASGRFGHAVALAGRTAVVGVPFDDGAGVGAGAVWVIHDTSPAGDWSATAATRLVPAGVGGDDRFGSAVALGERTMVVGAPLADAAGIGAGAAFLLRDTSPAGDWSRWDAVPLRPSAGAPFQGFGRAVALAGGVAVIGSRGAVFLFRDASPAGDWSQVVENRVAPTGVGDSFASALAACERGLLVGEPEAGRAGLLSGAVYLVEDRSEPGDFGQTDLLDLTPRGLAAFDRAGRALAMTGHLVVVGAPGHDVAPARSVGSAFVLFRGVFSDGFESGANTAWVIEEPTPTPPPSKKRRHR